MSLNVEHLVGLTKDIKSRCLVILPRGFTAGEGECRGQGLDLTTVRNTEKLDKMLTELTNTSPH